MNMSKIAILGDLHIGIKQADAFMEAYQLEFFNKCLFPYLNQHKITTVLQTGDWFDSRRAIRHSSMNIVRNHIIPQIGDQQWYVLVGNHDMGERETIHPNACTELLGTHPNFTVVDKPKTYKLEGVDVDLIPWICKENKNDVLSFIENSNSLYCCGHFELSGFYYYKGVKSEGRSKTFLQNYNKVWSGHYHTQSKGSNVHYLGTPYQLTFGDADDPRGFWVYDTETSEIEFVPNPVNLYTKVKFDQSFNKDNLERFDNMHVRLTVDDRGDAAAFDMLVDQITERCLSLDIVDSFDLPAGDTTQIDINDTLEIMNEYIDELDEDNKTKKNVKKIVSTLYRESISD